MAGVTTRRPTLPTGFQFQGIDPEELTKEELVAALHVTLRELYEARHARQDEPKRTNGTKIRG